jgi:hypothetical protein
MHKKLKSLKISTTFMFVSIIFYGGSLVFSGEGNFVNDFVSFLAGLTKNFDDFIIH